MICYFGERINGAHERPSSRTQKNIRFHGQGDGREPAVRSSPTGRVRGRGDRASSLPISRTSWRHERGGDLAKAIGYVTA